MSWGKPQGVPAVEPLHYGSLHAHLKPTTLLTLRIIYATGLTVSKAVCRSWIERRLPRAFNVIELMQEFGCLAHERAFMRI